MDEKKHREIGIHHTTGFEDEEWGHKPRDSGSL